MHRGDAQLHAARMREVQVALDVGGVDDVDDAVGVPAPSSEVARDDLLAGVRPTGSTRPAGRPTVQCLGVPADGARSLRSTVTPGKLPTCWFAPVSWLNKRGLAAVLVAHQREGERAGLRGGAARMGAIGLLGRAELAEAGVRQRGAVGTGCGSRGGAGGLRARSIGAGRGIGAILRVKCLDAHVVGFAQAQRHVQRRTVTWIGSPWGPPSAA